MIHHLFCVFDNKVAAFNTPYAVPTQEMGLRGFIQACHNPESELAKYPNDYSLFYVGEFDDSTGEVTRRVPENFGLASSFIRREVTENAS